MYTAKALFAYLDHAADAAAIFNDHQTNMTKQDAAAVVSAYDFRECARVVDVGGGHGALTAAILKACPWTTAVLFDRPAVIEGTRERLHAEGVIDRCTCIAGDFFDSVPEGGDAYVLKDIVHDWDDDRAMAILRNCRWVMAHTPVTTTRVLVVEKVIPPGNAPFPGKLTDITMLLVTGGRERTAKEYEALDRGGLGPDANCPNHLPCKRDRGGPRVGKDVVTNGEDGEVARRLPVR